MDLVSLLVLLLVIGIAFWVFQQIPLGEPFRWIAAAILGIVLIAWLLGYR